MADQKISNRNQTVPETAYRFGGHQLFPHERLLKCNNEPVSLTPKTLDVLLCLVSKAGRLVTKDELMDTVWPGTYVAEANLTNAIVSLRKIVGREAIRTVSKHGYRFESPVEGEPGVTRAMYESFSRAKELTEHRSLDGLMRARDLYWQCLAEDPGFAPAWAWLGRTSAILGKFSNKSDEAATALAHAALKRAFAIDPDLACAHQFYTPIQTDGGLARQALERLALRLARHPTDPETLAGLVQALRFCGLLDQSVEAHKRAKDADPTIRTSISHTLFLRGEFAAALESYGGRAAFYLDAAAWAALGDHSRCRVLLSQRLPVSECSAMMASGMASLLAITERRFEDAVSLMQSADNYKEPEMSFYMARHFAFMERPDDALRLIRKTIDGGFLCSAQTLCNDPWLNSIRTHPGFAEIHAYAESLIAAVRKEWRSWELGF